MCFNSLHKWRSFKDLRDISFCTPTWHTYIYSSCLHPQNLTPKLTLSLPRHYVASRLSLLPFLPPIQQLFFIWCPFFSSTFLHFPLLSLTSSFLQSIFHLFKVPSSSAFVRNKGLGGHHCYSVAQQPPKLPLRPEM